MPMSSSRATVDGQSLVCSVVNTRWPVSAARMPICAVSRSRVSPTRMTSGSCRRKRAERGGERAADPLVDLDLVDALEVVLDRILGGHDVDVRRVDRVDAPSRASSSCRSRSAR